MDVIRVGGVCLLPLKRVQRASGGARADPAERVGASVDGIVVIIERPGAVVGHQVLVGLDLGRREEDRCPVALRLWKPDATCDCAAQKRGAISVGTPRTKHVHKGRGGAG